MDSAKSRLPLPEKILKIRMCLQKIQKFLIRVLLNVALVHIITPGRLPLRLVLYVKLKTPIETYRVLT